MRRIFLVVGMVFLFGAHVYGQVSRGVVKEGLIIKSEILRKDVRYTVYLPFDYDTSARYYPVVYLLHGHGDNDMGWIQFGEANLLADDGIGARQIPPMILVMPDGGVSWYINNHDGSVRYEDFFFDEFVPYIESTYRIRTEKEYRGIAGLSMGGYGALVYSLKRPEMFTACAAFSAGVCSQEKMIHVSESSWENLYGSPYGAKRKGKDRITQHFLSNNPLYLVENSDVEKMKSVRMYIDCGDDDFLAEGNSMLHFLLRDLHVSHEYRVRDGGHEWSYWRSGLLEGLKFIGTSFHQP